MKSKILAEARAMMKKKKSLFMVVKEIYCAIVTCRLCVQVATEDTSTSENASTPEGCSGVWGDNTTD